MINVMCLWHCRQVKTQMQVRSLLISSLMECPDLTIFEKNTHFWLSAVWCSSCFLRNKIKISSLENWAFLFSIWGRGIHIKFYISNMLFHLVACLAGWYQTQGSLFTFTYKGRKFRATYLSMYKRGPFSPSEGTVSNITGQLARKRERNGEANYFCELAKGHFKLCAHDIIMFMVNIIVGDSESMAWEDKKKKASISDQE